LLYNIATIVLIIFVMSMMRQFMKLTMKILL